MLFVGIRYSVASITDAKCISVLIPMLLKREICIRDNPGCGPQWISAPITND